MLRKRQIFIDKYGPVAGPKLYRALQSQAAYAGVSARLRRKLRALESSMPRPPARRGRRSEVLPLFPEEPGDQEDQGTDRAAGVPTAGVATGR